MLPGKVFYKLDEENNNLLLILITDQRDLTYIMHKK